MSDQVQFTEELKAIFIGKIEEQRNKDDVPMNRTYRRLVLLTEQMTQLKDDSVEKILFRSYNEGSENFYISWWVMKYDKKYWAFSNSNGSEDTNANFSVIDKSKDLKIEDW